MNRTRAKSPRTRTPGIPDRVANLPWDWIVMGLYAAVMGIVSFGMWPVGGYGVETDAFAGYLPDGARLLSGSFTTLDGFKGPGYHLAVAAVGFIVRDLFIAAKLIAIFSASAVLLLTFRLVRKYLGAKIAWVTFAVIATNAQFALYTIQVGTDLYFLALAVAAGYLILDRPGVSRKRHVRRAFIAGALAGLAYLTRYNGLFLLVGGTIVYLLADWKEIPEYSETSDEQPLPWRTRAYRTIAFIFAAALMVLPWSLFTYSQGRGFFYNVNYLNIAYEMFGADKVSWDQFWEYFPSVFHGFGDVLSGQFGAFIAIVARNSVTHLWLDFTRVLMAGAGPIVTLAAALWCVLIVTGIVSAIRRYRLRAWPVVLLGLLTYGVLVPVFYGERFSLPMLVWYAVLASIAAIEATRRASWPDIVRFAPALALALLLTAGAYVSWFQVRALLDNSPVEVHLIAKSYDKPLPEGSRVLARKPHIAWFLGAEYARIPLLDSIDELPEIARSHYAKYLFVSSIEAGLRRPLIPLLDPRNAPPYLRPIVATRGRPAVLYEFTFDVPPAPHTDESYRPPDRANEPPLLIRIGDAYRQAGRRDLAEQYYRRAAERGFSQTEREAN